MINKIAEEAKIKLYLNVQGMMEPVGGGVRVRRTTPGERESVWAAGSVAGRRGRRGPCRGQPTERAEGEARDQAGERERASSLDCSREVVAAEGASDEEGRSGKCSVGTEGTERQGRLR